MSGDIKNFPPSELKLERLRSEGIFPYSRVVFGAAVVLGASLAFRISSSILPAQFKHFAIECMSGKDVSQNLFHDFWGLVFSALACGLAPIICVLLFVGLLQSKFFFRLSQLSFDLTRSFQGLNSFKGTLIQFLNQLILVSCACAFFVLGYYIMLENAESYSQQMLLQPQMRTGENFRTDIISQQSALSSLVTHGYGLLNRVWLISLFFSLVLGLSCYLIRWLRFRREHMMSRTELESELREQEASPELGETLRQRQSDTA